MIGFGGKILASAEWFPEEPAAGFRDPCFCPVRVPFLVGVRREMASTTMRMRAAGATRGIKIQQLWGI